MTVKSHKSLTKCIRLILLAIPFLLLMIVYSASIIRLIGPLTLKEAIFTIPCHQQKVALTIDDGPDPTTTPQILDVLKAHSVTATFFIVGERGEKNKDLLERIHLEGHELANHTYVEQATIRLNKKEIKESIYKTHQLLSQYQSISWLRPGTAFYNQVILDEAGQHQYKIALGDAFPFDTIILSSQFHAWHINHSIKPGSIIVLHDARERGVNTAKTLAMLLPTLKSRDISVSSLHHLTQTCSGNNAVQN